MNRRPPLIQRLARMIDLDAFVLMLHGRGASVLARNQEHNTPLHLAVLANSAACVKALLQVAGDSTTDLVQAANLRGSPALHLALEQVRRACSICLGVFLRIYVSCERALTRLRANRDTRKWRCS